ncbi:MAG: substrate-binding domain-containing protein [Pseudomonadota bacterium]
MRFRNATLCLFGFFLFLFGQAWAAETSITLSSTTSTENSGLYDYLLPIFTAKTGIRVRVVAVGTGQAIKIAERGDADVLLVHHRASEDKFVADGFGTGRRDVMYNDFIVVGPGNDPANIGKLKKASEALKWIAEKEAPFISRGDDSGTHKMELDLWKKAGLDVTSASGTWYREAGSGMGATLNMAAAMGAYALTDRGTWLSFQNRRDLVLLVENDPHLYNYYGVILVNPVRFPHVNAEGAQAFVEWITSEEGQRAIGDFKVNGERLFFPNAKPAGP